MSSTCFLTSARSGPPDTVGALPIGERLPVGHRWLSFITRTAIAEVSTLRTPSAAATRIKFARALTPAEFCNKTWRGIISSTALQVCFVAPQQATRHPGDRRTRDRGRPIPTGRCDVARVGPPSDAERDPWREALEHPEPRGRTGKTQQSSASRWPTPRAASQTGSAASRRCPPAPRSMAIAAHCTFCDTQSKGRRAIPSCRGLERRAEGYRFVASGVSQRVNIPGADLVTGIISDAAEADAVRVES